jgi:rhodanese-related sulfurtransferase
VARTPIIIAALAIAAAASAYVFGLGSPHANEMLDLNEMIDTVHRKFPDVKHVDTAAVEQLLKNNDAVQIVDVREPEEFKVSHLPGAINVPPESSDEDILAKIKPDHPTVVYCSVGWRSSEMAERLQATGRTNVVNYAGSIFAWANAEQPLESSGGATKAVHPYDKHWGRYLKPEHRAF